MQHNLMPIINPNLPKGVVGKMQNKKNLPEGEQGRVEKKLCLAHPPGLEPGTYLSLDESPQLHATERQASLSVLIDMLGRLRNTTCGVFWR